MRAKKILCVMGLTLLGLTFLTGCLRYDLKAAVDESGTVTGSMIFALNKDFIATTEQMSKKSGSTKDSSKLTQDMTAGITSGSVETLPYDRDGYQGSEIRFTAISSQDFIRMVNEGKPNGTAGGYLLDKQGDNYVFQVDLANDASQNKPQFPLPDEMLRTFQLSLSITFPGTVVESNGEVSGNTVTWHPSMADHNQKSLFAKGKTTKTVGLLGDSSGLPTSPQQGGAGGGITPGAWIGGGAAIALAGVAGTVLYLRHRPRR